MNACVIAAKGVVTGDPICHKSLLNTVGLQQAQDTDGHQSHESRCWAHVVAHRSSHNGNQVEESCDAQHANQCRPLSLRLVRPANINVANHFENTCAGCESLRLWDHAVDHVKAPARLDPRHAPHTHGRVRQSSDFSTLQDG